jgi:hypothetical protein
MLKAGNRLILALLGAALAAGLLTSVYVRPQSALTASEVCYGTCPASVTELFLSTDFVFYGHEHTLRFEARVRGERDDATPTGQVVVEAGKKVLCTIHLSDGMGECSPSSHALKPGFYAILAHYSGPNFAPSTSFERTLIVLRHDVFFF